MTVKVYNTKPSGFAQMAEVVAAYVEADGKLLLMQQSALKSEPDKWGVPAGKRKADESIDEAMVRELYEETGLRVKETDVEYVGELYIRRSSADYKYHMFRVRLNAEQTIRLSKEHVDYKWVDNPAALPLMTGAIEALDWYSKAVAENEL